MAKFIVYFLNGQLLDNKLNFSTKIKFICTKKIPMLVRSQALKISFMHNKQTRVVSQHKSIFFINYLITLDKRKTIKNTQITLKYLKSVNEPKTPKLIENTQI